MWTYSQSTGNLTTPDETVLKGVGYSGNTAGLDNPAMQNVHNVGPIPQGFWDIGDFFDDPGGKGPIVAHLTPAPETETFGRSGLMIHGDNSAMNKSASEGCVILSHNLRIAIRDSNDTTFMVTE